MAAKSQRRQEASQRQLDRTELDGAVGLWLRLAQGHDLRRFSQALEGSGISPLLYSILVVTAANPGCRQADLADALRIRQPNLVEPIEGLISRGLVARTPDPSDRRAQTLRLTRAGEALVDDLRSRHEAMLDGYRERLGAEDYGRLIELLRLFTAQS